MHDHLKPACNHEKYWRRVTTCSLKLYVAKSNAPAKNLYAQYGFEVVEEFETSYNGIPVFANKMIRFTKNA